MANGYPDPAQPSMFPPAIGQGMQGMFGGLRSGFQRGGQALHPYSNRLMLAGLGMLGGGPSDAMKGLVAGSALDMEDADRTKLNKALAALMESGSPLIPDDPAIRGLMGADDKFAEATLLQRMKPADVGEKYQGYLSAKAEGYAGDWMQYQTDLAKAGQSNTNINTVSKFSDITALRGDFDSREGVSRYRKSVPQLSSMASSVNDISKMSDYDFVYGLAQIFDPGSAVRESEQGFVLGGQSVPESVRGKLATILAGGAGVSVQARRDLVAAAGRRVEQYRQQADREAKYYRDLATRHGIDPEDIVRDLDPMPDLAAMSGATAADGSYAGADGTAVPVP